MSEDTKNIVLAQGVTNKWTGTITGKDPVDMTTALDLRTFDPVLCQISSGGAVLNVAITVTGQNSVTYELTAEEQSKLPKAVGIYNQLKSAAGLPFVIVGYKDGQPWPLGNITCQFSPFPFNPPQGA